MFPDSFPSLIYVRWLRYCIRQKTSHLWAPSSFKFVVDSFLCISEISGSNDCKFSFAGTATFPCRSLTTLPQIIALVLLSFYCKSELVSAVGRSVKVMWSDRAFEYFLCSWKSISTKKELWWSQTRLTRPDFYVPEFFVLTSLFI